MLAASEQPFRPLKIALLGYRSNPYSGGQGIYLKYLSEALVGLGHSVDVISGEPYPELAPAVGLVKLPGLNLYAEANHLTALRPRHLKHWSDVAEWASMASGGFAEPYAFGRRVARWLASNGKGYDIVHDNQCLASGLLQIARSGKPLLVTIHHPITMDRDIALANEPRLKYRLLIRRWHQFLNMQIRVARQLPTILTVSESSRRDIARDFDIPIDRIHVVYNGIDTETFHPISGKREPKTLITTASADQPLKGTQHLMPALRQLIDADPAVRLIMIGRPKPDGATQGLIDKLGLAGHIEFYHGISAAQITELYARASVAVVPSEYEGFGLPAGEAMACGVPVVSSDGGALPEVVGDAGIVVPAKSPAALTQAIGTLLADDLQRARLAEDGRRRIVRDFSWRGAAEATVALYGKVIEQ